MSWDGVISVRFPPRLLGALCIVAKSSKRSLPRAVSFLIQGMKGLTAAELSALSDPPSELDNPKVSLYVGHDCIALLTKASKEAGLSMSSIVRRLAFGLLVDKTIWFVQDEHKRWVLAGVQKSTEIQRDTRGSGRRDEASQPQ